jgi:Zn-dependent peptidase ImmA (M78 family)
MRPQRQKVILDRVNKLLKQSGVSEAPVEVEAITGTLGIEVRKSPTEDDISGFLLSQHGLSVIGVNSIHHANRQRFTIAHEIGHFLLHQKESVHVDRTLLKLRSSASSTGADQDEIEANRFAAELLIPRSFLEKDLTERPLKDSDLLDDQRIQQLAKRYQVSVQAMTNRLINLRYLSVDQIGSGGF